MHSVIINSVPGQFFLHSYTKHLLMSSHIRKQTICIGKNKGADQLCSNCKADQRFVFATQIVQSFFFLNLMGCFCDCICRFVSDLVRNRNWFPHTTAYFIIMFFNAGNTNLTDQERRRLPGEFGLVQCPRHQLHPEAHFPSGSFIVEMNRKFLEKKGSGS